jgi:hypothetical protein
LPRNISAETWLHSIVVEEPEVDKVVKEYLDGKISLDEAAERVLKPKRTRAIFS